MPFTQASDVLFVQTWSLQQAEIGDSELSPTSLAVASLQIAGTFGGATVSVEISNDGTNWLPLRDRSDQPITATAAGIYDISTGAARIRAKTTGGDGSTDLNVTLAAWRG